LFMFAHTHTHTHAHLHTLSHTHTSVTLWPQPSTRESGKGGERKAGESGRDPHKLLFWATLFFPVFRFVRLLPWLHSEKSEQRKKVQLHIT